MRWMLADPSKERWIRTHFVGLNQIATVFNPEYEQYTNLDKILIRQVRSYVESLLLNNTLNRRHIQDLLLLLITYSRLLYER